MVVVIFVNLSLIMSVILQVEKIVIILFDEKKLKQIIFEYDAQVIIKIGANKLSR